MQTKSFGNLFELAAQQLQHEQENGQRKNYSMIDIIDYATVLRKQLDRYGKKGTINKVKNIHTGQVVELASPYSLRHLKYLETGK